MSLGEKYVSDKAAGQKGYLLDVPAGGGFTDMVALKGDKEIGDKMNKIIARLTGRIRQLAERYATPLPQLTDEVATLAARVDGHLKRMGAKP